MVAFQSGRAHVAERTDGRLLTCSMVLLRSKANANQALDGTTALMHASGRGHVHVVEISLREGKANANRVKPNGILL